MTAEQFRPKFSTSASAAEERLEEREETLGKNYQRVHTVEGTVLIKKVKPSSLPCSTCRTWPIHTVPNR